MERNLFAIAVAAVSFGLAATAGAQTNDDSTEPTTSEGDHSSVAETVADQQALRERVTYLLSGYHFEPSRDQLDELADPSAVADTLRTIAADEEVRPSLRGRAVDALAMYDDQETVAFLEGLIAPPEEEMSEAQRRIRRDLRHRAILAYAESRSADRAIERLAPLLTADDRQIQLTVVAALGQHTGEAGKKKLSALAADIEDDIVRDELTKYIDRVPSRSEQ